MQIDTEQMLRPIRDDAPCGEDMSFSREFDLIQEARRADDPTLDQGDWVSALKEADWPGVATQASDLLATRTKDLRLAVWLTEALAKIDGFAGLGRGFELLARLAERYWEHLHPLAEAGDQEQRVGNLSWLVSRAAQLARMTPLTNAPGGAYSLLDYEAARALQAAIERDPEQAESLPEDKLTLQRFQQAQRATPADFYLQVLQDIAQCKASLYALADVIDRHLGAEGPSFALLRESLEEAGGLARRLAREAGVGGDAAQEAGAPPAAAGAPGTEAVEVAGPIRSRAQALRQLRLVAEFFRRTEPHSPVAYLADKAARWGEMPLHAWLRAVVKDDGALAHIEELLGLEPDTARRARGAADE